MTRGLSYREEGGGADGGNHGKKSWVLEYLFFFLSLYQILWILLIVSFRLCPVHLTVNTFGGGTRDLEGAHSQADDLPQPKR